MRRRYPWTGLGMRPVQSLELQGVRENHWIRQCSRVCVRVGKRPCAAARRLWRTRPTDEEGRHHAFLRWQGSRATSHCARRTPPGVHTWSFLPAVSQPTASQSPWPCAGCADGFSGSDMVPCFAAATKKLFKRQALHTAEYKAANSLLRNPTQVQDAQRDCPPRHQ